MWAKNAQATALDHRVRAGIGNGRFEILALTQNIRQISRSSINTNCMPALDPLDEGLRDFICNCKLPQKTVKLPAFR
jgi:hypothetical protein